MPQTRKHAEVGFVPVECQYFQVFLPFIFRHFFPAQNSNMRALLTLLCLIPVGAIYVPEWIRPRVRWLKVFRPVNLLNNIPILNLYILNENNRINVIITLWEK